jgi:hypothetical protein
VCDILCLRDSKEYDWSDIYGMTTLTTSKRKPAENHAGFFIVKMLLY